VLHTVYPALGTTVTLEDGVTVIDEHGATLLYTKEIQDLLLAGLLLDYDPRDVPTYDPVVPPSDGGITAFTFSHPSFSVAGAALRRLWTGYSTATWAAADAWKPRYVIPDAGTLISLTVQHGVHEQGGEDQAFLVYTVWRSTNFGATWAATTLTRSTDGSVAEPRHVAGSVAVNRGDLIGVEVTCSAATTGTDRLNATVLYRRSA
jgi:hypothetical protein